MTKATDTEVTIVDAEEKALETPPQRQALTPMDLLDRALNNGIDGNALEKLLDIQERWEKNQARRAFDAAMSAMRGDMPTITKSSQVDFKSSKGRTQYMYEDLSTITEALSPVMAKHGLSFRWRTQNDAGNVVVTCVISHSDGHYEETTLSAGVDNSGNKNPIQAMGSAVTYLQRYTLKAAVGIAAAADDDGQGGQGGQVDQNTRRPKAAARELFSELQGDIEACGDVQMLQDYGAANASRISELPADWENDIRNQYRSKLLALKEESEENAEPAQ